MVAPSAALKELLDGLHDRYNMPAFVEADPVSIPHRYAKKEDVEIAGFLAATIAWGQRKSIVGNGRRLIELMGDAPHDFVLNASESDLRVLLPFVHRTFNGEDALFFVRSLRNIYVHHGGLGGFFESEYLRTGDLRSVLSSFHGLFFTQPHPARLRKHVSSIDKGAACKRLNMFLRWMVRRDGRGVDFGLWPAIPASALYLPLDVHSASVGRHLGLLARRQNDWRTVEEITAALRRLDPADPVRYDFALFGAGADGMLKANRLPDGK